jgi:hypothetical protein
LVNIRLNSYSSNSIFFGPHTKDCGSLLFIVTEG